MTKTKPSVTKAFQDVIYPEIEKDGFIKLSNKEYARFLDDGILQYISIYVENRLRREYILQYGTMLLYEPHEYHIKTLGEDFSKGTSGGSYGADNEKMLEKSIQRACTAYQEEIRPILQKSENIELFIESYEKLIESNSARYSSGHEHFTLSCAYSILGKKDIAKTYCKIAQQKYKEALSKYPSREWAALGIERTQQLYAALEKGSAMDLHVKWLNQSISSLKINKLFKNVKTET